MINRTVHSINYNTWRRNNTRVHNAAPTNILVIKLSRLRWRTIAQDKPLDIGLVTRLQNRVKELEREKKLLQREVDLRDDLHGVSDRFGGQSLVDTEREIYETIKVRVWIIGPMGVRRS